jgi:DNA-binding NtrC family response regulator
MPSLNGLQIAEKISSVYARLPIILHTIHLFPAMIDEAKKAGIREVVGKGVTAERLLDVIERLLKENSGGATRAPGAKTETSASGRENGDGKPPALN